MNVLRLPVTKFSYCKGCFVVTNGRLPSCNRLATAHFIIRMVQLSRSERKAWSSVLQVKREEGAGVLGELDCCWIWRRDSYISWEAKIIRIATCQAFVICSFVRRTTRERCSLSRARALARSIFRERLSTLAFEYDQNFGEMVPSWSAVAY